MIFNMIKIEINMIKIEQQNIVMCKNNLTNHNYVNCSKMFAYYMT